MRRSKDSGSNTIVPVGCVRCVTEGARERPGERGRLGARGPELGPALWWHACVDAASAAQFISNIDGVDIIGFDMDFNYKASEEFTILGGIGLTDTEITDISGPVLTQLASSGVNTSNLVGNRTPKNTPISFNIAFEYQKEVGQLEMLARLDYEYKGKKYWQIDNWDVLGRSNHSQT